MDMQEIFSDDDEGHDPQDHHHQHKDKKNQDVDIYEYLIIPHDGYFIIFWRIIDVTCCILSSYLYAWTACFGDNHEDNLFFNLTVMFEGIFTITILIKFTTSYAVEGETKPVKSHSKIAHRYIHDQFFFDLIPWVPIVFLTDNSIDKFWRLFYLLKMTRIYYGLDMIDVGYIMNRIKNYSIKRIKNQIIENPDLGEDTLNDNNKITTIMHVNYCMRTFRVIIILLNICYFFGTFWYIYVQITLAIHKKMKKEDFLLLHYRQD